MALSLRAAVAPNCLTPPGVQRVAKATAINSRSRVALPVTKLLSSPFLRSDGLQRLEGKASPVIASRKGKNFSGPTTCKYLGSGGGAVSNAAPSGISGQAGGPGLTSLLVALAIPLVGGALAGLLGNPNSIWYEKLKKPDWEPPKPFFGLVWTVLYAAMGYASWLVWREGGFDLQGDRLKVYAIQLFFNILWPVIMFSWKNISLALIDMIALLISSIYTYKAFEPVSGLAANLIVPLTLWVVYATALNYNLWRNNRGPPESPTSSYAS